MRRRGKLLALGVALVAAGALVAGGVGTTAWLRQRDLEDRIRATGADALVAADTGVLVDRILRARTVGLASRDAITRTSATTALVIERARRAHARKVAQRRAERQTRRRATAPPVPQPRPSGGLLVGDSVALGAEACLTPLGYDLDAEVGRQFDTGLDQLRRHAADGLPDTVVVELGTNGPFSGAGFEAVMGLAGSQRRVVWVTIALPDRSQYAFRTSLNDMIAELAARHPNARVADFATAAARHPEWLYGDGIHLTGAGCTGFAQVVDGAVRDP